MNLISDTNYYIFTNFPTLIHFATRYDDLLIVLNEDLQLTKQREHDENCYIILANIFMPRVWL